MHRLRQGMRTELKPMLTLAGPDLHLRFEEGGGDEDRMASGY